MDKFEIATETNYQENKISSQIIYTYDEQANLTQKEEDYHADGTADLTYKYTYGDRGELIREDVEYDNNLTTTEYVYDEDNLIRKNIDRRADGVVDEATTYTYDAQNNLVESLAFNPNQTDCKTYNRFDNSGNLIEKRKDEDGDGKANYITFFAFDENDNKIRQDIDSDGDGSIDRIKNYVYDAQNNLTARTYDNNADGEIEPDIDSRQIYTNVYDENNNLIEQSSSENGVIDNIETYDYDDLGNLIRLSIDEDADGEIDEETAFTYAEFASTVVEEEVEEVEQPVDEISDPVEEVEQSEEETTDPVTQVEPPVNEVIEPIEEEETPEEEVEPPTKETDSIEEIEPPVNEVETPDPIEEIEQPVEETPALVNLQSILESGEISAEVHRFYQPEKGFYFYTSDLNEVDYIKEQSEAGELAYRYEEAEYMVLSDNIDPLTGETIEGVAEIYRFFNTSTGAHLYTMDENEKSYIVDNLSNYVFEGTSYYAFEAQPDDTDTTAVYRIYDETSGIHSFSTDLDEVNSMAQEMPNISIENNGEAVFYVMDI